MADIDWPTLRAKAREAGQKAYAPYSKLKVGVAGLTEKGEVLVGCNVENASYGLTLCAECALVSALAQSDSEHLVAVACTAAERDEVLMPCGRCRQLLNEFVDEDLGLLVDTTDGPLPLSELLPRSFGPKDL